MDDLATYFTAPEVARMFSVGEDKVRSWIRNKELDAVNVASTRKKRPVWRISNSALDIFKAARSPSPSPSSTPRPRRQKPQGVREFF